MTTDQDRLNHLADVLVEDILNTPDEEILAEAKEDGIDVNSAIAGALRLLRKIDGEQA